MYAWKQPARADHDHHRSEHGGFFKSIHPSGRPDSSCCLAQIGSFVSAQRLHRIGIVDNGLFTPRGAFGTIWPAGESTFCG